MNTVVNDLGAADATELAAGEMARLHGGVGALAKLGIRLAVKAYIEAYDNPIDVGNLLEQGKEALSTSKQ